MTISLWPDPSLYVSKSGFFTFQEGITLGKFYLCWHVFSLTLLWFPAFLRYLLASFGFGSVLLVVVIVAIHEGAEKTGALGIGLL